MDDESSKKFEQHQAKLNGDVPASALTVTGPGKGNANVKLPGTTGVASVVGSSGSGGTVVTNLGLRTSLDQPPKDPKAWTISKAGSVAQYYYRDDNFVPSAPGGPLFGTHQTFQNQVLSSLDGYVRAENQDYAFEAHASAFNQVDLANLSTAPNLNLSTVYLDSKFKQENIGLRAGRQSKSTGGIFGRFDGVVATWEGWSGFKLQGAGGSPVLARDAMPFSNDRWFGSGSIEYTSPKKDWGAAIYAIEQNVGDLVDRRAIGGEARYSNEHFNVYSAADYDIFFHTLNNAYISGTWLPRQGMSIYGTIDYRKTPFLTASNALSGQPAIGSLQELANALGVDLTQCALDRTATSETASAGISNQFSDKWQGSLDVSVSQYLGTPPSPACSIANPNDFFTPDSGINVYASATLSGSSLFKQNDSLTTSLRMGYSPQSITYGVDASYRYPVNDKLRISPRAQVNFRKSLTSDQFQYMVGASLGASYRLNNHWTFESEAGLRYQNSISAGVSQPSLDFTISAGYRYEFD